MCLSNNVSLVEDHWQTRDGWPCRRDLAARPGLEYPLIAGNNAGARPGQFGQENILPCAARNYMVARSGRESPHRGGDESREVSPRGGCNFRRRSKKGITTAPPKPIDRPITY